ncbi:MAG: hypothetical protein J3Q66DRAFT_327174 [Benniella sp.]|nr:MAG: hypothetical protein J3Q66DRAFT_327174 [Benniella sp.]
MFKADSFISFHDLTPDANYLWVSPTVYDILGYDSEDLIGMRAYSFVYPDDLADSRTVHKENLINDLVASQIVLRYKSKDGRPVHCLCVFSLCYDFIVNCATLLDPGAEAYVQLRAHSSAMTRMVGSKKEEFERIKRHHEAFAESSWDHQVMEPEARVCLIINRFTRSLTVMYASSACEKVFRLDPDDLTGKPILLYIRADDLAPFVEQVNLIKSSSAISQMRFWFQSPNWPREIPCEAIVFGSADGIVAVIRRCRPFVRKHLLGSRELYEARSGDSGWASERHYSYDSSPASSYSTSPVAYSRNGPKSPSPPRNITRDALNRIKIVELEGERARPLIDLPENDPCLLQADVAAAEVPGFKEVIIHDYDDDDGDDEVDEDTDNEEDIAGRFKYVAISGQREKHGRSEV